MAYVSVASRWMSDSKRRSASAAHATQPRLLDCHMSSVPRLLRPRTLSG